LATFAVDLPLIAVSPARSLFTESEVFNGEVKLGSTGLFLSVFVLVVVVLVGVALSEGP